MKLCEKKNLIIVFMDVFSLLLGRLDNKELTVKQREDATVECRSSSGADIIMLRWEKPELQSNYYVFYFSDGHIQQDKQHKSFESRVKLKDPKWRENEDFSMILKNISMNDAGIYECYAGYKNQVPVLLNSTNLKVEESGPPEEVIKDGGKEGVLVRVIVGVIVGLLIVILQVLVV